MSHKTTIKIEKYIPNRVFWSTMVSFNYWKLKFMIKYFNLSIKTVRIIVFVFRNLFAFLCKDFKIFFVLCKEWKLKSAKYSLDSSVMQCACKLQCTCIPTSVLTQLPYRNYCRLECRPDIFFAIFFWHETSKIWSVKKQKKNLQFSYYLLFSTR